jgi:hypothetical protein
MQKGPKHFSIEEEEEESFIFPGNKSFDFRHSQLLISIVSMNELFAYLYTIKQGIQLKRHGKSLRIGFGFWLFQCTES